MIRRVVVPAPPRKPPPTPPAEAEFIVAWTPYIRRVQRDVVSAAALGMADDDVMQDMRVALLTGARRHWTLTGEWPPPRALTRVIITRRARVLARNARVSWRASDRLPAGEDLDPVSAVPDPIPSQEERVAAFLAAGADEELARRLILRLRTRVSDADVALLMLRYVDELTPTQIAELTGAPSWRRVTSRLARVKAHAQRFLWELLEEEEG